ncbi:MAG TPA: hypothetical protein VMU39_25170 [Solirubrobacteraceae bacterium]|nr:hypothetical protein [Solirubrobacteraceae bacterium]
MKRRVMIQADETLLARARKAAGERGITFPQLVRDALEHELGVTQREPLSSTGTVESGGQARLRNYQPDAWR